MSKSIVIGLGHRSRHGKDTVAGYMMEWFQTMYPGITIIKQNWAWKLKQVCFELYAHLGLREPEFYDTEEGAKLRDVKLPSINKTPVEIWIDFGTPAVREQVWDRTWVEYVKNLNYDLILCPDTRFHNEIEACDFTIKVVNPRILDRQGKSVDNILADFNGWDLAIINDLGFSELRGRAYIIAESLYRRFFK